MTYIYIFYPFWVFLVYGISGWSNFIFFGMYQSSSLNTIYWRVYFYFVVCACPLCWILIDHRGMGLFLSSLFCSIDLCVCSFKDFIYLFLDRGEGMEKERERNINVWLPVMYPLLGTWLQPRYVPWLGIEPATLWFAGHHSIHWDIPAGLMCHILRSADQRP